MPNKQKQPNEGQGMRDRDSQGQFTEDRDRNASDRNREYGKGLDSGREGKSSQSKEHMSDMGREGSKQ